MMRLVRPSPKVVNGASVVTLVLTGLANVSLFLFMAIRFFSRPVCQEHSLQKQVQEDARMLSGQRAFPIDSTAYLSHVVMAIHESGAELKSLIKAFQYWKRYPPCTHNGYPTNWAQAHVKMVYLMDRVPSEPFAKALTELYYDLPRAVRSCFAGLEIRQSGLDSSTNSTRIDDLSGLAKEERDMFEALFTNKIQLDSPSHVLLLTPDTVPLQANWMNLMDYETRVPVERFWIKGSIYRGPADKSTHQDSRSLLTMNKVALYNIGDPAFGKFYSDVARPFIQSLHSDPDPISRTFPLMPVEHDFTNYLFQFQHYRWTRMMVALFRPTDAIQDYTGAKIDVAKIQHDSPDTLIVRGIAPDLPPLHVPKP